MKIVVIGAGAMGCYFAARIAEAEAGESVLIEIDGEKADAINRAGISLIDKRGERNVAVRASAPADFTGDADLLVCFTKGMHTRAAMRDIIHAIGPRSLMLTLQNGLGNVERIAEFVDVSRIMAGVTDIPADFLPPASVRSPGEGAIRFWHAGEGDGQAAQAVEAMLRAAGFTAFADPHAKIAIWEKLTFNAALNAGTAILRQRVAALDNDDGRALIAMVIDEVIAVARAAGIEVERRRVEAMVDNALATHRDHQPSMLQDVLAGRETEVDSINGAVAARAAGLGMAAPVNAVLARLVKLQNRRPE